MLVGCKGVQCFESNNHSSVGTPKDKFVQILLIGGNHWITVSNVHCESPAEVKMYDSIYSKFPATARKKVVEQVAWLLYSDHCEITFHWPDVQHQTGSSACGAFAIANAYALCAGISPEECAWDQRKIWSHLESCLTADRMSCPPVTGLRISHGIKHTDRESIYCKCRQPDLRRRFMAQCMGCSEWYHRGGEVLPDRINESTVFFCHRCS